jgi:hypothetical protein
MINFYTPEQANDLLPEIKKRLIKIINKRNEIVMIQNELNSIISDNRPFEIFFWEKNELNRTISSLYKEIEEVEELGVLIKSLDEGLVDFASKRFDEEVWLCWKVEEETIKFWHGKNEGFIGRKPLSVKGSYNEDKLEDLR